MRRPHPAFQPPTDPNTTIWRYLDFYKFVDMLERRALFFARLDTLGDAWEGARPKGIAPPSPLTQEEWDILERDSYNMLQISAYANCWHMSPDESLVMWQIYGQDGVAIRSTFERLNRGTEEARSDIDVGIIQYEDHGQNWANLGHQFMYKRHDFNHEQELRATFTHLPEGYTSGSIDRAYYEPRQQKGYHIKVDIERLIDRIYIAPGRKEWFQDLVRMVSTRYLPNTPVQISRFDRRPPYA